MFKTSCLLVNKFLYKTYFIQFLSWDIYVSESYKIELPKVSKNTETLFNLAQVKKMTEATCSSNLVAASNLLDFYVDTKT